MKSADCPDQVCVHQGWISDSTVPIVCLPHQVIIEVTGGTAMPTPPPGKRTARVTRLALLTAIALTIFMAEAQIPVAVPIPGVKLGLANIVTVYAVFVLGPGDALLVLTARVFLGAVFSGQMMTLFYSLGGGLLCWAVLTLLRRLFSKGQIWLCSPVSAVFHNLGSCWWPPP